ncbi:DNA polymerase III subunit gamma/tau, partial [Azoarcus sp. L1K30]|uniref:DNA polymerase III subunit gamma/tau C-terminal domain-containing protein n=1 Tax=Azoarcus sp. L1K30 TaxID=2820277 RepID=UPI001B84430F
PVSKADRDHAHGWGGRAGEDEVVAEGAPKVLGPEVIAPTSASVSVLAGDGGAPDQILRGAFAAADWRSVVRHLGLGGLVRELAQHCEWVSCADDLLVLRLSDTHRHLLDMNRAAVDRVQEQLAAALARPLRIRVDVGAIAGETPAQRDEVERQARHAIAVAALESDPFVRELIDRFDATLVETTVKPL